MLLLFAFYFAAELFEFADEAIDACFDAAAGGAVGGLGARGEAALEGDGGRRSGGRGLLRFLAALAHGTKTALALAFEAFTLSGVAGQFIVELLVEFVFLLDGIGVELGAEAALA